MKHKIYIVHGILGGPHEYIRMRRALRKVGFVSDVFTYRSRKELVLDVGKKLYERIKQDKVDKISLIAHSLGGLVLRAMLVHAQADENFPVIDKVVMIATPNQGAASGDYINSKAILRFIFGINIRDIKNDDDSLAKKLPTDFNAEVGIIAGARGKKRGYNPFMDYDNDGEIYPEETKLGTEKAFLTVKSNHVTILQNKKTVRAVARFMQTGEFE